LACKYDKAHLFKPLGEDIHLQAGADMPPVINVEGLRVSPAICYDLRFPEMFRRAALLGVDLFLVSSEWPVPREHVLRVLSESRAIENQAVLALSNRIGVDNRGNRFCGESGIFGPNGIIVDAMQKQGVIAADIDIQTLVDSRRFLSVLSDRLQGIDYV
jgi:omega-amidase